MTAIFLAPYLLQKWFDNNGNPLVAGTIATYAGGTNTPIATYTDSTGGTPNANPITLNFRGECSIWLTPNVSYKFVVSDALGNLITTVDNVVNAALISLFGGTDTGTANNYILNFASPVPANTNGTVIYWLPSNSNTGPSTLNANGGGPTPIVNPNGTPLGANQILSGQFVSTIYINGVWQLYGGSGVGVNVGTFGAEVPLAAASTVDLGSVPGHNVLITGSAAISSFGTSAQIVAPIYVGRFSNSGGTLTPSASLIVPGNNIITITAGDAFLAEFLGNGAWKILSYQYFSILGGLGSPNCAVKASDTARQSTTTLTADPDLSVPLFTGQYSFELFLLFDSVAAGAGFKFQSNGTAVDSRGTSPAGATGLVNAAAYGPKLESFVGATLSYATVGTAVDSNQVLYKGSLLISTAGTFGIQWAQAASTASNTTLRAGSYLNCTLLGQKTGSNATIRIYTTSGTASETIPAGVTSCTIEVFGGGGGGGTGVNLGGGSNSAGGGGGSGGYARTVVSVSGSAGLTMQYTVGAAGNPITAGGLSQVISGTFAVTSLIGNGGNPGGTATTNTPGTGGGGGTATGGSAANTTGNAGTAGTRGNPGSAGAGGAGVPGINYGGLAGGNGGTVGAAQAGGAGVVVFSYT